MTEPIVVIDASQPFFVKCPECQTVKPVEDFPIFETVEDEMVIKNVGPVCECCKILAVMRRAPGEWMTAEQIMEAMQLAEGDQE